MLNYFHIEFKCCKPFLRLINPGQLTSVVSEDAFGGKCSSTLKQMV
jgi:hypothetical protein